MKQRLLTILCAISLLLCAAILGLWIFSHRLAPYANGIICFDVGKEPSRLVVQAYHGCLICAGEPMKCDLVAGSLHIGPQLIVLPLWPLALLAGLPVIPLGMRVMRHRQQRRRRELGLCMMCGYDLRASAERCPECGTATPEPALPKGTLDGARS